MQLLIGTGWGNIKHSQAGQSSIRHVSILTRQLRLGGIKVLSGVVNMQGTEHIGVVLMPQHSWKANASWQVEVDAMQTISNAGLSFAKNITLAMPDYTDVRDDRPPGYPMRLVHSGTAGKDKVFGPNGVWRAVPAAKTLHGVCSATGSQRDGEARRIG